MKKLICVLIVTLIHVALSIAVFVFYFSMNMIRSDLAVPVTVDEQLISLCGHILLFPIVTFVDRAWLYSRIPGVAGFVPFLLNSLIWGVVVCFLCDLYHRVKLPRTTSKF